MASSEGKPDGNDMQLAASPVAMRMVKEVGADPGSPISAKPGITFAGSYLRPKSRGTVPLVSSDDREIIYELRGLTDPGLHGTGI